MLILFKEERHIKTRLSILFLLLTVMTAFTGCTLVTGAETYLKPPKLSEQHEKIYNALINSAGSKINLKYPKTGAYLSAFVVADIDDEPTDEAIVFYEKTIIAGNDTSTLRINFLDQDENGKWKSVCDFPTEGTEVERVFISKLGQSDIKNVIIGVGNQNEKIAQLFSYTGGTTKDGQTLGPYSVMDIKDLNNDNQNELIMIHNSPEGKTTAQLKWLDADNTLVSNVELTLNETTTETAQMIYGKINSNTTAIYLDSYTIPNTIITEIIYPSIKNDTIDLNQLNISNLENETINKTIRQSSLLSKDIDGDDEVEIPINSVFKGYEDKPDTEQKTMTNWYTIHNGILTRKYSSYYSVNDGYAFILPERWINNVTVKIENDDVVFMKYSEINKLQSELLRLCVINSSEADAKIKEGKYFRYEKIYTSGDTVYLACIPDGTKEPLVPSLAEIQFSFKPVH